VEAVNDQDVINILLIASVLALSFGMFVHVVFGHRR
jgi:hypothetical protein